MTNLKYQISNVKIFLIAIMVIASILRLWNLSNYPAGFNADEAAIGYNAYSILKTGKDEYGSLAPLAFKSFGDYKPGLYFYFVLPFVSLLGLSEVAVRLPSAILGVLTVLLVYFIARRIFKSSNAGLASALLLSISPWHIHFSRGGWETNAATFFITLGVYLLVRFLDEARFLFWSLGSFLVSMYLYQSPRIVVPVFLIILGLIYRKSIRIGIKKAVLGFVILAILSVPLVLQFTSGAGQARFSGLSFLSDLGPENRINELRGEHADPNSKITVLLHNKVVAYGASFMAHYLDHFNPDFLFINGDSIIRDKVPETGQFYLFEAFLLIAGLFLGLTSGFKYFKLLVIWVLIGPLASSLTFQTPNAVRSLNIVVPLTMVMGYGLWVMGSYVRGYYKHILFSIFGIILLFEFVHYIESYYVHYPKRYPLAWEYGFSEMVSKLDKLEGNYNNVVITDRYDQPYILVLFYKRYDPAKYQPQAVLSPRDKFNFGTVRSFDKYKFRPINPDEVKGANKTLFIGTDMEIPKDSKIVDQVNFPDGSPAFIFAE